ncbi:thiol reductant ABC exporter subunit CydC [Sporosarcina limicola]|uniref:ATP-binding cassette subfamily C protein CydC n=1 Tax=Sporosarcina limicola TaxID=34101 RepID=A0A927MK88_9BACL|nr:thiol reductant ABC exporter subunit CydC [Sporosarcina limicola]MBE1555910.1 ATP-binding cassette subfamily C protein CydC [Sporosarcina limicola]
MNTFQSYVMPYVKKYKKLIVATIFLGTLSVLSAAMLTFTSGYLISRASERPETILLVYVPIVAVRTFGISRAVLRYLERLLGHNAVLKILSEMRVKLYRALEPQALFINSRFTTGDLLGTLADDIEHLQDVYIRTIFPTLIGLFLFVFATLSLAIFDWVFALVMAFCLAVIVVVYPLLSLYILKKRQLESKVLHSRLYETLTDAIFGISDWIISGRKEQFVDTFMKDSHASHEAEKKLSYWHQSRTLQLQVFSGLLVIIVGVWAGFQAAQGEILPIYIAAFTLVTMPIIEGLIPLSHAIERIPAYEESLRRVDRIHKFGGAIEVTDGSTFSEKHANIEISNVSYRYEGQQRYAVENFSLLIPQGQKIAILGKSGSGKSTLIQLLLGALAPTDGQISVNGHQSAEYGETIYDMMSVLNQKPYLFATTVENNIRLGKRDATTEEIEQVVAQVRLDAYIHSLPDKLRTQMEETGQRFSGGERQRIALARILLKDTPCVILDEPTVGLDPETEYALVDTMLETLKDKTVIWITHHLTGIESMDHVIFMDEGEIAMQGTHDELMESNERYRQLYKLDRG